RGLPDYPHFAFEMNRFAPKGGLYTAARVPMQSSRFIGYQNRGRALSSGFADWALQKGVLVSRLVVEGLEIIVMNTHLHANYAGNWSPEHPMAQIQQDQVEHLVQLVNEQPAYALVLVCGDFNFPRRSFLYDQLLRETALEDPLFGDTRPTYRPFPLIPSAKFSIPIDFCLVRQPLSRDLTLSADVVHVQDATRRLPHQRFLTDHNALTLQVVWE